MRPRARAGDPSNAVSGPARRCPLTALWSPQRILWRLRAAPVRLDDGPVWWRVAYGVVMALVLVVVAAVLHPGFVQDFNRSTVLGDAIRAYDHGLPLGVGMTASGQHYPVALGDDLGLFVVAPPLARLVGITDPLVAARLTLLVFFVPACALAPVLLRRLGGAALSGVLGPLAVLGGACVFEISPYWAMAWAFLFLLPLVLWMDRRERPWGVGAVALVAVVGVLCGLASTMRGDSGAPVLLALLAVLATRREWRIGWRGASAALAIVLYVGVSSGVPRAVESARTRVAPYPDAIAGHVIWHNAYIGLGYLPNRYGIWWNDGVALRAARRYDPGVVYVTNRYERDMRHLVLTIVTHDPGLVVSTLLRKLAVTVMWSLPILLVLALTLPVAMRGRRRAVGRLVLLIAPALLFGLLPGELGQTIPEYLYGWLSATLLLGVISLSVALEERRRHGERGLTGPRARWGPVALAAALLVIGVAGLMIKRESDTWAARHGGDTAHVVSVSLTR
jgi:hypothetical protein